jgi:hypothetical protein
MCGQHHGGDTRENDTAKQENWDYNRHDWLKYLGCKRAPSDDQRRIRPKILEDQHKNQANSAQDAGHAITRSFQI